MKCNPWRWLWGLLPLMALLTGLTIHRERDRIEQDLRQKTEEALGRSGIGWAQAKFDGRDGIILGRATEEEEAGQAIGIARGLFGVRVAEQRADLIEKVDTYLWSAQIKDNRIKLSGYVPNEATRKTILGVVKANFPKNPVDDDMKLARGAPPKDAWLGGVNFALKQLASLKRGTVDLNGTNLSISGEAEDSPSYKEIKTALANTVPGGVRIASDKVTAPVVSPYTWAAKHSGGQLVLTGHVPSDKLRDELVQAAKKNFPKSAVVDRMDIAEGAPEGWQKAASGSIEQLAILKEGAADLKATQLTLTGEAKDEATAEAVRKGLKSRVPSSFKTSEAIKFPKPAVVGISPYRTWIDAQSNVVELTGYVPSDAARAALVNAAKKQFAGRTVIDRLLIGAGAPEGWQTCMTAALSGLRKLGSGHVVLLDKRVGLEGETQDQGLFQRLPGEVTAEAKGACESDVRVKLDDARKLEAERKARDEAAAKNRSDEEAAAERKARELEQARKDAEAAEQRLRGEEADAKRKAMEAAEQRLRGEEAQERRVAEESEARRKAEMAALESRKTAASNCQRLLRDVAKGGNITFKRASADLDPKSHQTLKELAKAANSCPEMDLEVEGHTDAEGTPERNKKLSERRAESVRAYLAGAGVNTARIKAIGYGETKPVAPNDSPENMDKNRRIKFTVKAN